MLGVHAVEYLLRAVGPTTHFARQVPVKRQSEVTTSMSALGHITASSVSYLAQRQTAL